MTTNALATKLLTRSSVSLSNPLERQILTDAVADATALAPVMVARRPLSPLSGVQLMHLQNAVDTYANGDVDTFSVLSRVYCDWSNPLFRTTYLPTILSNTYAATVAGLIGSSLLALWPLNEASGSAVLDASGNGYDGVYNSVTPADATFLTGDNVPRLDPASGAVYINIHSAGLESVFDGDEFSIGIWFKHATAPGATRKLWLLKDTSGGQQIFEEARGFSSKYRAERAGALHEIVQTYDTTTWHLMVQTFSVSNSRLRSYIDNAAAVETANSTAWLGGLDDAQCLLGAANTGNTHEFDGWFSHAFITNAELDAATIASIYNAATS